LRFVCDRIFAIAETIKEASETGSVLSTDMKKDVDELGHISSSFKDMIHAMKETTEEINEIKTNLEKESSKRKAAEKL